MLSHKCPNRADWVNQRDLEHAVFGWLVAAFGNAAAIARAVDDAVPNASELDELRQQRDRVQQAQQKTKAGIDRVVGMIAKGTLSDEDAEAQLVKLKAAQAQHATDLEKLDAQLAHVPNRAEVQRRADAIAKRFEKLTDADALPWEEKRALCEMIFSGKTADGKRLGVYVEPSPRTPARTRNRQRHFQIVGHCLEFDAVMPVRADSDIDSDDADWLWADGKRQAALVKKGGKTKAKTCAMESASSRHQTTP